MASNSARPLTHIGRVALMLGLIAAVIVPHYMHPANPMNMLKHEVHRHLLYLPILLAAMWYGWAGGLAAAAFISAIYFPHLFMHDAPVGGAAAQHAGHQAHIDPMMYVLAISTYLFAGGGVGFLFSRLRGVNARLAEAMERLTEQTREVFAAEEQLRRADRLAALGQLTSGLAHELRNPLASIRGAAEILGDANLPEKTRTEFSRVLIVETERLDAVLSEFLDYARTHQSFPGQKAELKTIAERALKLLESQFMRQHVVVHNAIAAPLPPLNINESLLQQVLLNLLLNAVQAMPEGGALTLAARPLPELRVEFTLSDTGPGIPFELTEQVFNPFFTTKPHGTGLGLAIVHKIMQSQGGNVRHAPNPPHGTRFTLEFEAAKP